MTAGEASRSDRRGQRTRHHTLVVQPPDLVDFLTNDPVPTIAAIRRAANS
jgi:hypothetical protein